MTPDLPHWSPLPAGSSATGSSGTYTAGASAQLLPANPARKALLVTLDQAATANVYLLLGSGTASASSFHIELTPGGSWDGTVTGELWTGAVQFFSSAGGKVGVIEE